MFTERRPVHNQIARMGLFSHESIDVDPRTGIVYLTEDSFAGSIPPNPTTEVDSDPTTRSSFLFRYLPNDRSQRPGSPRRRHVQALAIDGVKRNADIYNPGHGLPSAGSTSTLRWQMRTRSRRAPFA